MILCAIALAGAASSAQAATYWSLFNIEGEATQSAAYVTYASLGDMLADTNRLGVFEPNSVGFGRNVVDGSTDGHTYWSLFNIEGEATQSAAYVTYASLGDMLADTNRLGVFEPNSVGFGRNVVGTGTDGHVYWSLFNIEGEATQSAAYVTYATLGDMLADTNRLGVFEPNSVGFGRNVVGGGSDGHSYWSLFNIEGEATQSAAYVTYASLGDMLADTNRLGVFEPNSVGFGKNVVGTGSDLPFFAVGGGTVPEPATWALMLVGFAGTGLALRRRAAMQTVTG